IRNPGRTGGGSKSICIWANELRVTDFNKSSGWAANARLNAQIADVAVISSSIRHNTFGFGGLETRLSERARESSTQYDVSANVNVDKILPQGLNLSVPLYISFENSSTKPQYDQLNADVPFEVALQKFRTDEERQAYNNLVIDQSRRKNFALNNVRKLRNPEKETNRIYDLENFSASYAYGSVAQSNIQTQSYVFETYRGNLAYNYQPNPLIVEPFKDIGFLDNKYLQLIKYINFNFVSSMLSERVDVDRTYMKTQNRNDELNTAGVDPLFQKSFFINRFYSLNWDLTENLSLDFSSSVNAVVDEPEGELDTEAKLDSLRANIKRLGRTT